MVKYCLAVVVVALSAPLLAAERPDIVIADFETETWGDWTVEGDAFGPGPVKGTLPGQMHVDGYQGERLVNSFHGGDKTVGVLDSPLFRIERKHINFLIGGGGYEEETLVQLIVDARAVRTATGPNTRPGGSERLDWKTWEVAEFEGRNGMIRIIDRRTGGWGHINVDQIVQSDRRLEPVELGVEPHLLAMPAHGPRSFVRRRRSPPASGASPPKRARVAETSGTTAVCSGNPRPASERPAGPGRLTEAAQPPSGTRTAVRPPIANSET